MKDSAVKQKFIELRAAGLSYQKIAEDLGVSKQTLINWSRDLGDVLMNYTAIERDHVLRQFQLVREAKVKRLGSLMAKLEDELAARDLGEIPTEKIFDLVLKFSQVLQKEVEPTQFRMTHEDFHLDLSSVSTWIG